MNRTRNVRRLAAVGATSAIVLGTVILAAPANAAVSHPNTQCNSSQYFQHVTGSSHAVTNLGAALSNKNNTNVTNHVTFQSTVSGTVSASVTGTIEGGVSAGIASAKASVSTQISASASYTKALTTEYDVAPHKTGYAQMGVTKYTVKFERYHYNNSCVKLTVSTGTLKAPTTVGWTTWMS